MRHASFLSLILFVALCPFAVCGDMAEVDLHFSPNGGCQSVIVDAIDNAKTDIHLAAYSFSSDPIAEALYRAANRGITVRVILDRRQPTAHYSMADELYYHGLFVRVDRTVQLMHMKVICIDDETVLCGSYNFTKSAEKRNAEILTVIKGKEIAIKVRNTLLKRWYQCDEHEPKPKSDSKEKTAALKTACVENKCPVTPTPTTSPPRFRRFRRW